MGGAFLSRLNAVLREDKGYTYGVRMNFSPLRSGGSFAVQGSFRTEVVVDALSLTRELIDVAGAPDHRRRGRRGGRLLHRRLPAALRHRRRRRRPGRHPGAGRPAATTTSTAAWPLLRSVTPESATAAYRSLVDLDDLTLVVVGDADQLADPLRASGFPDLEVITTH